MPSIYRSIPLVDNVGVLVNDELDRTKDSDTVPEKGVQVGKTLAGCRHRGRDRRGGAGPAARDRTEAELPHGHQLADLRRPARTCRTMHRQATEAGGGTFHPLQPGESLDI